jgi:3-hydroxybutyryl-CoA dehydrogenase
MGRGIAQGYALAGCPVVLVDLKKRSKEEYTDLEATIESEIGADMQFLVSAGLLADGEPASILDRITTVAAADANVPVGAAEIIYEAVPETVEAKRAALGWIGDRATPDATVASTTSTLGVVELSDMVTEPSRFLNAHWLNPAHLMPLVEVSVSDSTSEASRSRILESLRVIGKVPVVCSASPGYIVPRIQALAMNEAARLVEENVATAEEIDTAIRVGFGLRFAVLGLLEFIDWGGNDIVYHATRHLSRTVDADRYTVPDIVERNMAEGRNGVREGAGFYEYEGRDIEAYRNQRLEQFTALLKHLDLLPAGLGKG